MPPAALPSFVLPEVGDNSLGWGPPEVAPSPFMGIPFAPFIKSDKLGRVSDWNQANPTARGRWTNGQYQPQGAAGVFDHKDDDETQFSLVDNRPKTKPKYGRRVYKKFPQNRRNPRRDGRGGGRGGRGGGRGGKGNWSGYGKRGRWGFNNWGDRSDVVKESSVTIQEDWQVVGEEIDFAALANEKMNVPKGENLRTCGSLEKFNPAFDRVTTAQPVPLHRFENRQYFTASTSDDPVVEDLAAENAGNIYATDAILSTIMAATKSVNPWDILVRKENGVIFLDKRLNSRLDYLSVNENWNEVQEEDKSSVNHADNLATEATWINQNFSQQCVDAKLGVLECERPNPFLKAVEEGNVAGTGAYRYRRWDLGDGMKLVARTFVGGYTERKGENFLTHIATLNEFDSKLSGSVDWRQKLGAQPGAVLAAEMKNNANKITRWTAETSLSGAEEFRLGFVSRRDTKDSFRHVILATKRWEPAAFASQVNVKLSNLWGVLKFVLTKIKSLPDGHYLLLKDPNKSALRIYAVPADAFNEDGEDEGDDNDQ